MKKIFLGFAILIGIITGSKIGIVFAQTIQAVEIDITPKSDSIIIGGVIEKVKIPSNRTKENYVVTYSISENADMSNDERITGSVYTEEKGTNVDVLIGVKMGFLRTLNSLHGNFLTPGKTYYVKIIISYQADKLFETDIKEVTTKTSNDLDNTNPSTTQSYSKRGYTLLAPIKSGGDFPTYIPGPDDCQKDPSTKYCNFGDFLNFIIQLAVSLAAVALVIKLVINGYRYMVSDVPFLKGIAKQNIFDSIIGIVLALTAYLLLNTINPKLVNNDLVLEEAVLEIENPEGIGEFDFSSIKTLNQTGKITCPESGGESSVASIAESFIGKVSYNQNRRNTVTNGNIYLDCSSYVATVLSCAGYNINKSSTTATIFSNAERITTTNTNFAAGVINGKSLKPGDLLGWRESDKVFSSNGKSSGHVLIYVGNGIVAEVHGPTYPGKGQLNGAARKIFLNSYKHKSKIIWVKRI